MYYYTFNNQQFGPVDEAEIKRLIAAGTINHGTMVWTQGMANWELIGKTALGSLLGVAAPPVVPPAYAPAVIEDPEVVCLRKLFTWFWISLIAIFIGIGVPAALVLFFVIIWKAWKMVQREGIRATPDEAVAFCFVPGWNFYWVFPALRGLAKEFNDTFDKENVAEEKFNLDMVTWMIICLFGSGITVGLSLIAFLVLWIMYTNKVKNAMIALHNARK